MRISEIDGMHGMRDRFDVDRFLSRRAAIIRKAAGVSLDPSGGYRHGVAIDLIAQLMRGDGDADRVYDLIDALPGAARIYLMRHVVRIGRDGLPNPAYRGDGID